MAKVKENDVCYICGKTATSVEHAPARCFFPKGQAKEELLTVPSCEEHNEKTSIDDEYVRFIIASCVGNNNQAKGDVMRRSMRTLERSSKLKEQFGKTLKPVWISDNGGKLEEAGVIQLDRKRFDKVIRKIGYALFFHRNKTTWLRNLNIATTHLLHSDGTENEMNDLVGGIWSDMKQDGSDCVFSGSNPDVFDYIFFQTSADIMDVVLIMRFYENFEIWCCPVPGTTAPLL